LEGLKARSSTFSILPVIRILASSSGVRLSVTEQSQDLGRLLSNNQNHFLKCQNVVAEQPLKGRWYDGLY
jgi:hypothetical protein